jgi:hypothetical protein
VPVPQQQQQNRPTNKSNKLQELKKYIYSELKVKPVIISYTTPDF